MATIRNISLKNLKASIVDGFILYEAEVWEKTKRYGMWKQSISYNSPFTFNPYQLEAVAKEYFLKADTEEGYYTSAELLLLELVDLSRYENRFLEYQKKANNAKFLMCVIKSDWEENIAFFRFSQKRMTKYRLARTKAVKDFIEKFNKNSFCDEVIRVFLFTDIKDFSVRSEAERLKYLRGTKNDGQL